MPESRREMDSVRNSQNVSSVEREIGAATFSSFFVFFEFLPCGELRREREIGAATVRAIFFQNVSPLLNYYVQCLQN